MNQLEQRKRKLTSGIVSLFLAWLLGVGLFLGIIWLGLVMSKKWLPFVVLGVALAFAVYVRARRMSSMPMCYRLPAIITLILALSGIIMLLINMTTWEPSWIKPQTPNERIPYVSALIVYPVAFACSLWHLLIGRRSLACVHCQIKNGSYNERGLITKLFYQESTFQMKFMLVMAGLLSVIDWTYYYMGYVNVNYNNRDLFFFVWLPTALTVLSVVFFFSRYSGMWRHYCHNPAMQTIHGDSTAMRYLVIVGDHIFLDLYNGLIVDTPVKCFLRFTTEMPHSRASETFHNITGLRASNLHLAYESEETTTLANTFHYLVYYDSIDQIEGARVQGQLYSLNRVLEMVRSRLLAPELRSELERIYTVAMAWKTYTLDGKRIYPVKNYKPSFRFRDIPTYNVDYNDKRWLAVTINNEDKPFFWFRKFWNRYVNGI